MTPEVDSNLLVPLGLDFGFTCWIIISCGLLVWILASKSLLGWTVAS